MKQILITICLFVLVLTPLHAQTFTMKMNEQGKEFIVDIDWDAKKITLTDAGQIIVDEEIKSALVYNDDKVGFSFEEGIPPVFEMSYEKQFFILLPEAIVCNNKEKSRTYLLKPINSKEYITNLNQLMDLISKKNHEKVKVALTVNIKEVKFTMIRVEGGSFTMGATKEHLIHVMDREKPTHTVTLDDYYIGQTEVTQSLWEAVMGHNPSKHVGGNYPVENITWDDCHVFIEKIRELTGLPFRLPTEAEWEYAARGGQESSGYQYSGGNTLHKISWYSGNSYGDTQYVGGKEMNELGLYDMSGNVWELVEDWFGNYSEEPQTNPKGPEKGEEHIARGGSVISSEWTFRVSVRRNIAPDFKYKDMGLRLAL